jgi:NAD(P)-dependent dehydrogenase (short-subunit alcohol dehydrogenase family)
VSPLADRVALVTGASRGIGLAIAEALREAGSRVVRIARSLHDGHDQHFTDFGCDITDEVTVRGTVERLIGEVGVPDILVNNAGTFLLKPFAEMSKQELEEQLAVNLVGPFIVLRELLPHLIRLGRGRIVTIGSVADYRTFPGNAAYGASKRGLRALHEVLQEELAGTGVRATLISPGPTDTRLWDPLDPDRREDLPGRASMLQPNDVAEAVLFAVTRPDRVTVDVLRLQPGR